MSDVKLEAGQIWKSDSGNVRIILFVGKEKVLYDLVENKDIIKLKSSEHVTSIKDFIDTYANKLLPCWPPKEEKKKVKRSQALMLRDDLPFVTEGLFKNESEIYGRYERERIIKFPYGVTEEFEE